MDMELSKEMYGEHCFICSDARNASDQLINLDYVDERGIQWSTKLLFIAPELEWPNDVSICQVCMQNLEVAYNFKKQCLNFSKNSSKEENFKDLIKKDNIQHLNFTESEEHYENCDDKHDDTEAYISKPEYGDEEINIICDFCKENFSLKNRLEEHMRTIHNNGQDIFPKQDFITNHTVKAYEGYRCDSCKVYYRTEKLLNIHEKKCTEQPAAASHICIKCNKSFKHLSSLKNHENIVHKVKTSSVCDNPFNSPQELKEHNDEPQHEKKVTSGQRKTYDCDICQELFKALKELIGHYVNVHSLDKKLVKPYSCEVCGKRFRSSTNLMTHKLYHEGSRSHTCTACGKSFITKNDLMGHEKIHQADRNYKCIQCNKTFKTNTNLRTHCLIVHTDPALWKFSCSVCAKKFPMKSSHDQHFRRHTGEKNFVCVLCEKAFTSKSELQEHVRYHSNLRLFGCDRCPKEYRKKHSLLVHLAKTHGIGDAKAPTKKRKHACDLCPGTFPDKAKLARHLCSHSGRKPFACHACDKRFTDKSYLKVHLKRAHRIVDVSPS